MTFKFKVWVVDRSYDGYYVTRWDRAKAVEVFADNRDEALKKAFAVMGEAPRDRYWVADVDKKIEEVRD